MSEQFLLGNKKFVLEVPYHPLPDGYSLYQLRDDFSVFGGVRECAFGGCPAVVPFVDDPPDVEFTKDWQFYLVAINWGMNLSAIMSLMGYTKAFMNRTGISNPQEPRRNYLSGQNLTASKFPATDKFRSVCLNTHAGRDDGTWMYPLALDGTRPPPMKPGKPRPQSLSEIIPENYLITPEKYPYNFLDCTNVKWKPETKTLDYGPFDNGVVRPWLDNNIHTFFPFVTTYQNVKTPLSWWRKLPPNSPIPSAIRRG